jgi:hypothetical protein
MGTHTKANGQIIALMVKEFIFKPSKLEINSIKMFTEANSLMAIIMVKELCNMLTEINMKVNGLLEKSKAKECIIGMMEIIMMEIGKKTLQKVQALHALGGNFMMVNFT